MVTAKQRRIELAIGQIAGPAENHQIERFDLKRLRDHFQESCLMFRGDQTAPFIRTRWLDVAETRPPKRTSSPEIRPRGQPTNLSPVSHEGCRSRLGLALALVANIPSAFAIGSW